MISENMARELWRDPRAAIGKRIRPTPKDDWREIVGVVGDERSTTASIRRRPPSATGRSFTRNFEGDPVTVRRGVAFMIRTPRAASTSLPAGTPPGHLEHQFQPAPGQCPDP